MKKIALYILLVLLTLSLLILSFLPMNFLPKGFESWKSTCVGDENGYHLNSFVNEVDHTSLSFKFKNDSDCFVAVEFGEEILLNFKYVSDLIVNVKGSTSKYVTAYFVAPLTDSVDTINFCVLEKDIALDRTDGKYSVKIDDFCIKPWWYSACGLKFGDSRIEPNLSRISRIGFGVPNTSIFTKEEDYKLQVNSVKTRYSSYPQLALILLLLMTLVILPVLDIIKRKTFSLFPIADDEFNARKSGEGLKNELTHFVGRYYGNNRLTIQHVAEHMKVPRYKVNDIFKKSYNMSFDEYLNLIRMTEARRLLIESRQSVKEISSIVGFKHVAIFNRAFKSYAGSTPSSVRSSS